MQKITPFLWFDNNAEEALTFYTSLFNNAKIVNAVRYGAEGPGPAGTLMTATFQLEGQEFMALNGGPQFQFTAAISFLINCESQTEVDTLWYALAEGGEEQPCGWVKDKFGLSWQVVPTILGKLLSDPDAVKAQRVMHAMLQMKRIVLQDLQDAYDQE